jgi:quinol monooxygenase YgiN
MTRLLGLAAVLTLAVPAAADDHPIVASVRQQLKETDKPFTMLVALKVKEGKNQPFEAAFKEAIAGTRKEPGNLVYQLNRHAQSGQIYIVYERWKNLDALKAHVETPHIEKLLAALADLLDDAPDIDVLVPIGD